MSASSIHIFYLRITFDILESPTLQLESVTIINKTATLKPSIQIKRSRESLIVPHSTQVTFTKVPTFVRIGVTKTL